MRDYKQLAMGYCSDIKSGKIVACIYTKKAVSRFLEELKRSEDADYLYFFDWDAASQICAFVEELKPSDLNGKKITLLPWQIFIYCNLEGWRHKAEPDRKRFRHAYIEVNRKNGKTTGLLYGLTIYNFLKYKASESYLVSSRDDLAEKTFREIRDIIHADKSLDDILDCRSLAITFKDIKEKSRLGFFCDGGKDADGFRPNFFCVDEFHAFASDKMYRSMDYGTRAHKDALGVVITTADTEINNPCYQMSLKSKKILNKVVSQDDFFCIIFALDEDDDYHNPKVWQKANPSLYDIIDPSIIDGDIKDAELTPHSIPELKAKTFGIWGGGGEKSWMPVEVWQKNKDIKVDWSEFEGAICYAGLDLSQVDDLSGYTLKFVKDGYSYYKHRYYIPSDTLMERYKRENVNFVGWVEDGTITQIQGATIDYSFILRDFLEDAQRYKIIGLGYDKWNARDVIDGIEDARPDIELIEIEQSLKKLSPVFKSYEKEIKDGKLVDNSPLSLWCASNVEIRPDINENYKPMKKSKASTSRIDPIVSSTMAHGVWQIMSSVEQIKPVNFDLLKAIL